MGTAVVGTSCSLHEGTADKVDVTAAQPLGSRAAVVPEERIRVRSNGSLINAGNETITEVIPPRDHCRLSIRGRWRFAKRRHLELSSNAAGQTNASTEQLPAGLFG